MTEQPMKVNADDEDEVKDIVGFRDGGFNRVTPVMQIPRGQSHQFNAIGPNAVIDSVHPEESIETFREQMSGFKMMAQTIFLADEQPASESCDQLPPGVDVPLDPEELRRS